MGGPAGGRRKETAVHNPRDGAVRQQAVSQGSSARKRIVCRPGRRPARRVPPASCSARGRASRRYPPGNAPQTRLAGAAYPTALAILVLSLDRQYLPVYQRQRPLFE
jgi:hypothetical protein